MSANASITSYFGFANRSQLANSLRLLHQTGLRNHSLILDTLMAKGVLKGRFREKVGSLEDLQPKMLASSITPRQILAVVCDVDFIVKAERQGEVVETSMEVLENAIGLAAATEAINKRLAGEVLTTEALFSHTIVNVAGALDRIFPTANGIHSKLAHGVGSAIGLYHVAGHSGAYRLGFLALISLGVVATVASPLLFPAIGAFIATLGFKAALGLKIAGGVMTAAGMVSRLASAYVDQEGRGDNPDSWLAKIGRNRILNKVVFPLGLVTLYSSFTFGKGVANTFVLGNFLLDHMDLLAGLTVGLPLVSILSSLIYSYIGIKHANRACRGTVPPYGEEAVRATDIRKTYAYSGTATIFSLTYFLYRFVATSIFVTAAFTPITLSAVALTAVGVVVGFGLGYTLPMLTKKYRSPFPGFIGGTLGSVVVPMVIGGITGDYGSLAGGISAVLSLAIFAQDIHATSHGIAFHKGQINSLYPDRLGPTVRVGIKQAYAGYLGRGKEKPVTSFWEKAFVEPADIVFSVITSAFFEPNAHLRQCLLQCDAPNRGEGKQAGRVDVSIKIMEETQAALQEVYHPCREALVAARRNPNDVQQNYQRVISTLNIVGRYFVLEIPNRIKRLKDLCGPMGKDWKGIYCTSIDLAQKKGAEFFSWAEELERRLRADDQLTKEEVEGILLYLCERFDKELMIGIRKDSNEYTMRIQKNENQSGLREFIGNTGVEVLRYNEQTRQASVERILATHIRRQKIDWQHAGSAKYDWHHRADPYLAEHDPQAITEYRSKVRSHSRDLAFVINDEQGKPLALQTGDGHILLIAEQLVTPLSLRVADGTAVTISTGLVSSEPAYQVETIKSYNQRQQNKIYLVANRNDARQPLTTGEVFSDKMHGYYKSRPLYTYSIDPHDYEFNLDSEFVNGRIAYEYIPLFEADRQQRYLAVPYRFKRQVRLDYALSGLPRDSRGQALLPSRVQVNWSPMYWRLRTKDGREHVVPYLEEKNPQVEPTVVVDKTPVTRWQVVLRKYARLYEKGEFKNGRFVAKFNHERMTERGISEIELSLPAAAFPAEPKSAEDFRLMVAKYCAEHPGEKLEAQHKRKYNWRRIKRAEIRGGKIGFVYDIEKGEHWDEKIPRHHSDPTRYSVHFPNIEQIDSIDIEVFKKRVGTLPYARYTYRFATKQEAQTVAGVMPVREVRHPETGVITGYEFDRFGRPESIFELGAFDPASIEPASRRVIGDKLVMDAYDWGTKMIPVDRELVDLGTEDKPKAKVRAIVTDQTRLREHFGKGAILWGRSQDGKSQFIKLGRRVSDVTSISESKVRVEGQRVLLDLTRKVKNGELLLTDPAFAHLWYPDGWVKQVEFGQMTAQGRELLVYYQNPYTQKPLTGERAVQIVYLKNPLLTDIAMYDKPVLEQREVYDRAGNQKRTWYLQLTKVTREPISLGNTLLPGEFYDANNCHLTVLNPKAAVKLEMTNGQEVLLPLNDAIDGENYIFDQSRVGEEELVKFPHHRPHFEDGKVGLIIGPQLSISGRNWYGYAVSGIPYCALDQSIFMAYDLSFGYNYGRQPYSEGVGGGNIQPDKSRAGDGRIRETATVQNGTPVGRPLRKTIASGDTWNEVELAQPFFSFAPMPATITEDYREGKGIYKQHGHATLFYNKVVAVGAGVENMKQILTQRRRWPASVPIGQYWFSRDLWDELLRAKLRRDYPSFYTWDQLLHEWNGVTWYYCGAAENLRSFAPLAFFLGLTAYPVDSLAFPVNWFGSFASSMASHIYSMKKVGNHWLESVYWGQAAYKMLVPNYTEMLLPKLSLSVPETQGRRAFEELFTGQLPDEALGQFGVTATAGSGGVPGRHLDEIELNIWLKGAAFARGVVEMQHTAFTSVGEFNFSAFTSYFAIAMNTIWPFYDLVLNRGARQLALDDTSEEAELVDETRTSLRAAMFMGQLDRRWHPLQRNRLQYTLGITDAPKNLNDRARYLQELSARQNADLFGRLPIEIPGVLTEMLDQGLISPQKLATVFEAMLFDKAELGMRRALYFRQLLKRQGDLSAAELLRQAEGQALAQATYLAGTAFYVLRQLRPNDQAAIIANVEPRRRGVINHVN